MWHTSEYTDRQFIKMSVSVFVWSDRLLLWGLQVHANKDTCHDLGSIPAMSKFILKWLVWLKVSVPANRDPGATCLISSCLPLNIFDQVWPCLSWNENLQPCQPFADKIYKLPCCCFSSITEIRSIIIQQCHCYCSLFFFKMSMCGCLHVIPFWVAVNQPSNQQTLN